ncbi:radical SAM protein [Nitrospinaceae bacterium]|jgi:radical SAM superfamily enzyme YgiQ (UPF0313 family)|nr:radical SAM protein [Nitrospinaceae bacterium]
MTSLLETSEDQIKNRTHQYPIDKGMLLINIPQVPLGSLEPLVSRTKGYFAYPPQGLLYLAAQLRSLDLPAQILDLNYEVLKSMQTEDSVSDEFWQQLVDKKIAEMGSPFIGISLMFEKTFETFEKISKYIKRGYPKLGVAVGGVHASADKERILNEGLADFVFSHECESSLRNLLLYAKGKTDAEISNISILGEDSKIISTPMFAGAEGDYDITKEFDLIPTSDYHRVGSVGILSRISGSDKPFATPLAKRGCRAQCTFCGVRNFNGKGVREREVDSIIREMKYLRDNYQVMHFDWLDDDLLYHRDHIMLLFQRISEELPDTTWAANNGLIVSSIDKEMLDVFKSSNCIGFKIGLESGNDEILRAVKKPATLRKFMGFSRLIQDYPSIFVSVNIILGLPQETFGQMMDSFLVSIKSRLDWTNFYLYQPFKNTESYEIFGGLTDHSIDLSHGKDNMGPLQQKNNNGGSVDLNPVRGGTFSQPRNSSEIKTGYDIFDYTSDTIPNRKELAEIWFTFNAISNFLLLPERVKEDPVRLENSIRFLSCLSETYPEDVSIKSLLYFLMSNGAENSQQKMDILKKEVEETLAVSDYWVFRDSQFGFTDFLIGKIPNIPDKIQNLIVNTSLDL